MARRNGRSPDPRGALLPIWHGHGRRLLRPARESLIRRRTTHQIAFGIDFIQAVLATEHPRRRIGACRPHPDDMGSLRTERDPMRSTRGTRKKRLATRSTSSRMVCSSVGVEVPPCRSFPPCGSNISSRSSPRVADGNVLLPYAPSVRKTLDDSTRKIPTVAVSSRRLRRGCHRIAPRETDSRLARSGLCARL